jgi:hypothetical protein
MAIIYSLQTLTERIKRHIANGFPTASFSASDNEIYLYINSALAFGLVGQMYGMAKVEGNLVTPEGFLTTYLLPTLVQDNITKEWTTTLPQPPLSLPLGYSITQAYFADSVNGRGTQINFIKAKRVPYRKNMPLQNGVRGWFEGSKVILEASDGSSLLNQNLYATMATTRVTDPLAPMNVPDDILEAVFMNVVQKLEKRLQYPQDIIKDDLAPGRKE